MLGLTKTKEAIELVCKSDASMKGDTDEWTPIDNIKKVDRSKVSVVSVRALNDREILRLQSSFEAFETSDAPSAEETLRLADLMELVVLKAFVKATEGETETTIGEQVCDRLTLGQLIALGSYILTQSGIGNDPS